MNIAGVIMVLFLTCLVGCSTYLLIERTATIRIERGVNDDEGSDNNGTDDGDEGGSQESSAIDEGETSQGAD